MDITMAFQKCPICNGSGTIKPQPYEGIISTVCPVCNGQRIISELNGLPPIINKQNTVKGYPSNPLEKYNYIKERLDTTGRASIRQDEFDFVQEFEKNKKQGSDNDIDLKIRTISFDIKTTEEEYHNLIDKLQSMINNESTTD